MIATKQPRHSARPAECCPWTGGHRTGPTAYVAPAPMATPIATTVFPTGQSVPSAVSAHTGNYPPYQTGQFPAQEKKSSNGWLWAIIVILLAVLGFVAWQVFGNYDPPEEPTPTITMVDVPNLEGLDQTEARTTLEDHNLELVIGEPVESDDVEEGLFVSSNPEIGTSVEEGSTVTVSFSSGVGEVTVPDVTGLNVDSARNLIEAEGLVWGTSDSVDNFPEYDEGEVVSSDPAADQQVPRGTQVNVQFSSGRVLIPNLLT